MSVQNEPVSKYIEHTALIRDAIAIEMDGFTENPKINVLVADVKVRDTNGELITLSETFFTYSMIGVQLQHDKWYFYDIYDLLCEDVEHLNFIASRQHTLRTANYKVRVVETGERFAEDLIWKNIKYTCSAKLYNWLTKRYPETPDAVGHTLFCTRSLELTLVEPENQIYVESMRTFKNISDVLQTNMISRFDRSDSSYMTRIKGNCAVILMPCDKPFYVHLHHYGVVTVKDKKGDDALQQKTKREKEEENTIQNENTNERQPVKFVESTSQEVTLKSFLDVDVKHELPKRLVRVLGSGNFTVSIQPGNTEGVQWAIYINENNIRFCSIV